VFFVFFVDSSSAGDWRTALHGWQYEFPRDHSPHPEFKTEWWYFTGNLRAENGRRFGYQLTFFRQGIRAPAQRGGEQSRFITGDLKFAHFAVTDVANGRFHFEQSLSRGAFDEAGFAKAETASATRRLAWINDWTLTMGEAGNWEIAARNSSAELRLGLTPAKPWAIHGTNGVSQKAAGEGHASHYYSGTRLLSRGRLTIDGRAFEVEGESWFDHEWATNQLTPEQVGWNWFSIQLDDQTELMLYQMRTRDGRGGGARDKRGPDLGEHGIDPNSSGTFIARDGAARHLTRDDYTLKPTKFWTSKETGGRYPIAWEVSVPSLEIQLSVSTPVEKQELVLQPIAYWEGVIDIAGTRAGKSIRGHGYMELTGYAGELVGLSATTR
jgi:predicted secreted hydrolase